MNYISVSEAAKKWNMCIFLLSGCNTEKTATNETSDNTKTPNESTNIPNQDIPQGSIEDTRVDFPNEVISAFTDFIKGD